MKVYYQLKIDWKHPYITYPKGTTYGAVLWADKIGHDTTPEDFEHLVETDERFKKYFTKIEKDETETL